jgi:hypothetical protein
VLGVVVIITILTGVKHWQEPAVAVATELTAAGAGAVVGAQERAW